MTVYWVGDVPAEDLLLAPARAPEDYIDLDPFDDVDLTLRGPDGVVVPSAGELAGSITTIEDQKYVLIEWPTSSPFDQGGIWDLGITLLGDGSVQQRIAPVRLIVQSDDGWYSVEEAREDWRGAPDEDAILFKLLAVARRDVETYDAGRIITEDSPRPPNSLREAQLMQARNTWNANLVDPSGDQDDGSYRVTPFPLDWKVKQLIRPQAGIPVVG